MAKVKTLDLETFRSLIREVAQDVMGEMEFNEMYEQADDGMVKFSVKCDNEECAKVVYVELVNKLDKNAVQRSGTTVMVTAPSSKVPGSPEDFVKSAVESSGPVGKKYAPEGSYTVSMSEQDEIVAMGPAGPMDDEQDGDDEGVVDMDLSTPEGLSDALADVSDMLVRIADAVDDVVSTEGGEEDVEAADYALGEARRLVRKARTSIIRESKRKKASRISRRIR